MATAAPNPTWAPGPWAAHQLPETGVGEVIGAPGPQGPAGPTGATGPAGTGASLLPSGATGARPGSPATGQAFFDTTLGLPVFYTGSGWVNAAGVSA